MADVKTITDTKTIEPTTVGGGATTVSDLYQEKKPDYDVDSKDIIVVQGKQYRVFDNKNLNPYELDFIYRDQLGNDYLENPEFDTLRKEASDFSAMNFANEGPIEAIPFRLDDPRYKREYDRQINFLKDEENKRADPIKYYTSGMFDKTSAMALGGLFAPVLTYGGLAALSNPFTAPLGALAVGTGASILGGVGLGNMYDRVNEMIRNIQGFDSEAQGLGDQFNDIVDNMYYETLFTMGSPALAGVFRTFKPAVGKLLGLGKEQAQNLIQQAKNLGINLSPIHFSKPGIKGSAGFFGVIPFLSKFYKVGAEGAQTELAKFANSLTGQYAPVELLQSLGVDMMKASQQRFRGYRKLTDMLYNRALTYADKISAPFIPLTNVKSFAEGNIEKIIKSDLPQGIKEQYEGLMKLQNTQEFKQFFQSLSKVDMLDANQYRSLEKMLNESITGYVNSMGKSLSNDQAVAIMQLKNALKKDFNNVDLSAIKNIKDREYAEKFMSSLRTANETVAAYASLLDSPQASLFKKFDKGAFLVDFMKPGSKNLDLMFKDVFNQLSGDSLEAVDAMKTLLGNNAFNKAAGSWFQDIYFKSFRNGFVPKRGADGLIDIEQALPPNVFDPAKFEALLGIAGDTKFGKEKLAKILGPNAFKSIEKFISVAKAVDEVEVGDVSKYLTRKVTLGGLDRFIKGGALIYGAGAAMVSLPATIIKVLLGRRAVAFLNNPQALDKLIKMTDENFIKNMGVEDLAKYVNRLARDVGIPSDEEYEQMQLLQEIYKDIDKGSSNYQRTRFDMYNKPIETEPVKREMGITLPEYDAAQQQASLPSTNPYLAGSGASSLPSQVDPTRYASLFPFDITGQQAAASSAQRPRIAAQGGLGALLGFKGAN